MKPTFLAPLALALLCIPHFAFAQTTTTTTVTTTTVTTATAAGKTTTVTLPDARQLLDHLYDPYEAAKTLSGTFDFAIKYQDEGQITFSNTRLQLLSRAQNGGDAGRAAGTLQAVGAAKGQQQEQFTLRFADNGRRAVVILPEQKSWSVTEQGDAQKVISLLQVTIKESVKALKKLPSFSPRIALGEEEGRPVFILTSKDSDFFRAVVDAQTRALRSFEITGDTSLISIRGSNQTFNAPISDSAFQWTPPAGFRQVDEDSIDLPSFLDHMTTPAR